MFSPKYFRGQIFAVLSPIVLAGVATDASAVQGSTSSINPEFARSLNEGLVSLADLDLVDPGGNTQPLQAAADQPKTSTTRTTHVVAPAENLFRIALRYGLSMSAIAQANGITNPSLLFVGQHLVIPGQPANLGYNEKDQTIQYDLPVAGEYSLFIPSLNTYLSTITVSRDGNVGFHDPDTTVLDTDQPVGVFLPNEQAWDGIAQYFYNPQFFYVPDGIQLFGATTMDPQRTVEKLVADGYDAELGTCNEMKRAFLAAMVPGAQAARQPSAGTVRVVNLGGEPLQNVQVMQTHDMPLPMNSVDPKSVATGSSGHQFSVTFVAPELIEKDQLRFTAPTGFTHPQGTGGRSGYTTVASSGSVGEPVIKGNAVTVPVHRLMPGETVTFAYGSGGGASGVAAPQAPGRAPVIFETRSIYDDSVSILISKDAVPASQAPASAAKGRPVNIRFGPEGTTVGTDQFQVTLPRQGPLAVKKKATSPGAGSATGRAKAGVGERTGSRTLNRTPQVQTTDAQGRVELKGNVQPGDTLSIADGTCNTVSVPIGPGGGAG